MSYRVRDEHGNVIPDRVYGGDMIYGRGLPTVDISLDKVDAMAFAMAFNKARKTFKDKENEKMGRPNVHLKTDTCGRYHYATAHISRVVVLKDGCTYEEVIEAIGVSRRQHGDPKDDYVGEGLAVGRALEDLGYKLSRRAWGKVKHNDDIKVMRRQQKERRQDKAKKERTRYQRFVDAMPSIGKVG